MNSNRVSVKFTVWIGHNATQQRDELRRAARIWSEEDALLIVIVRMQIVPNHRLALEDFSDFQNLLGREHFADDFRARPHDVDACMQLLTDGREIFTLGDTRHSSFAAILRRTEEKVRPIRLISVEMVVDVIRDGDLSVCKAREHFLVALRHLTLDVVEEQSEMFAAKLRDLIELSLECRRVFDR